MFAARSPDEPRARASGPRTAAGTGCARARSSSPDEGLVYARSTDVTERKAIEAERENADAPRWSCWPARDALTGLPNRRALDDQLPREMARALREATTLCLAIVDIDHFKAYNDTHGHLAGDACCATAPRPGTASCAAKTRSCASAARSSSSSCPNCEPADATEIVERLRAATPGGQTCSAGLAVLAAGGERRRPRRAGGQGSVRGQGGGSRPARQRSVSRVTMAASWAPGRTSSLVRFRARRRDPELTVLEGFHASSTRCASGPRLRRPSRPTRGNWSGWRRDLAPDLVGRIGRPGRGGRRRDAGRAGAAGAAHRGRRDRPSQAGRSGRGARRPARGARRPARAAAQHGQPRRLRAGRRRRPTRRRC